MATPTSAEVTGVDGNRGTIAAGRYADRVLVDGDPAKDIGDIRDIDLVVKYGRLYDPSAIERAIGIAPRD